MSELLEPLKALVVPTERAPTDLELKRALLSFDEVHVLDPNDRDLMDPAAFMNAMTGGMMPFFMAAEGTTALPLPKVASFDDDFAQAIDAFDRSGAASSLIVRPSPTFFKGMGIGTVPTPEGWPSPVWTLQTFRALAADPSFLQAGATSLEPWQDSIDEVRALMDARPRALMPSNVLPDVTTLKWGECDVDVRMMDYVAAARLGSFVKALGMSAAQNLHPFTTDPGLDSLLQKVANMLRSAAEASPGLENSLAIHVTRVQSVVLEEVLDHDALAAASPADVIRLRNHAWGKAQRERARFLRQVVKLSSDPRVDFEEVVRKEAQAYLKACSDLDHGWKKVRVKTTLAFTGAAAASTGAGSMLLGQLPAPLDIAIGATALLLLHGSKISDQVMDNVRASRDAEQSAGAALLKPYRYFVRRYHGKSA